MYDDNDEQKLRMKGQTEMKHSILQLYLNPWMKKLSYVDSTLLFVDGFAGPGIYDGGQGSPLIAMDMADKLLALNGVDDRVDSFRCIFVEKDPENYDSLKNAVDRKEGEVDSRIEPAYVNEKFEDWASNFIEEYDSKEPPPSLIFIDPFGYSGFPFDVISEVFDLRDTGVELLITFMAGKMAQWMDDENHQKAISGTIGSQNWQDEIPSSLSKDERAERFSSIYQEQLKSAADAKYTMPFEMVEESKRQICYYLIHVTNHLEGLKIMKENMFNAGADHKFAYLGPDHTGFESDQASFSRFGDENEIDRKVRDFADFLHEKYKGQSVPFKEILKDTIDQNVFKVTHYRSAFEELEDRGKLSVENRPHLDGGNQYGYGMNDLIVFERNLEDFC